MAPAVVVSGSGEHPEFEGRITVYVIVCVIIAAFGGLMFGYDIGISGGVTSMDDFLKEFFPAVYRKKQHVLENNYCKYDNQFLQLFTSSLYLAALIASFVASKAVPLFLSEIAPARIRGALNISFQLFITIGILVANLINYFTSNVHPHGWRISLGIAGVPALMLCLGSILICETPTSLIERNKIEEGRKVLRKIRGVENIDDEFDSIVHACEMARQVKDPFRKLMKPVSRPPLIIAICLQVFQQFTGINAIMFYAPVLFQTVGFGNDAALLSSVITGLVNVFSTVVSVYLVDRAGRRFLLLEACVQMLISHVIIGIILLKELKTTADNLTKGEATFVVVMVCLFVMGFAWSWGPIGWLIPSETFPLETRSAGFAFAVSSNMLFTFVIAQAFLSMLCHMQAGIFFFFAGWIVIMGVFTWFLLPETKGVPVDSMVDKVWKQHWFWCSFMADDDLRTDVKVV
ncbi:sugar transport protein 8-like isoform X2 [Hibiscus syriacus]|uniref:sugar transport protein 8-like isoform X2 n=1 Tax=Hibiscus syriacus TaxID=106335 RepID=UPI001923E807|nr:sugar transport protein 8-like isoform X2 [Hibiscus syriacus]